MSPVNWYPWLFPRLLDGGDRRRPAGEGGALFRRRVVMRPMRLMVDAEITARVDDDLVTYLMELTEGSQFERYLHADDGPPADAPRRTIGDNPPAVDGWVYTCADQWPHIERVVVGNPEGPWSTGVWREDPRFELLPVAAVPSSYVDSPHPRGRMRSDLTALLVADAVEADAYVTEREFLLEREFDLARSVTVLHPREALPVVGLYLRSQGAYVVKRTRYGFNWLETPPRFYFFWAAAHHLLPASAQWSGAFAGTDDDDVRRHLPASLHQRVAGVLDTRDQLLGVLAVPQGNQSGEDALTLMTQIALWFMGAFDVAALVARHCLGLDIPEERSAWQRQEWQLAVRRRSPGLAALVEPGSEGGHVLTILREIRNVIHGEAMSPLMFQRGSDGPTETRVKIPKSREAALLASIDALGGPELWGAEVLWPNDLHLAAGPFMEQLVSRGIGLLNALMEATAAGRPTAAAEDRSAFAAEYPLHPMLPRAGQRIRWQLGLPTTSLP